MSASAARRLSVFTVNSVYSARHTTRSIPARRRQWQRTLQSTSRRWYADDTRPPPTSQTPGRSKQKQLPETQQEDIFEAAQEVVEEVKQPTTEAAATSSSADVPAGVEEVQADQTSNEDDVQVSITADISESAEEKLPSDGAANEATALPVEDSVARAAEADEVEATNRSCEASTLPNSEITSTITKAETAEQIRGLETAESTANSDVPEGAVLVSEEEEVLEDLLGSVGTGSQRAEPASLELQAESTLGAVEKGNEDGGFWNYTAAGTGDAEFLKDNVTSLGHDELEQQKEYREYARLAAWELPLLSSESIHLNPT